MLLDNKNKVLTRFFQITILKLEKQMYDLVNVQFL